MINRVPNYFLVDNNVKIKLGYTYKCCKSVVCMIGESSYIYTVIIINYHIIWKTFIIVISLRRETDRICKIIVVLSHFHSAPFPPSHTHILCHSLYIIFIFAQTRDAIFRDDIVAAAATGLYRRVCIEYYDLSAPFATALHPINHSIFVVPCNII